jgi:hypothetical protein
MHCCLSTATKDKWPRHNVTLYVHFLSCYVLETSVCTENGSLQFCLYALPIHHALRDSVIRLSRHLVVYRRADSSNCIISTPITEDLCSLQDFKQQDALKRMHDRRGERKHWIGSCGEMSKGVLLTWVLGQGLTCYCNVTKRIRGPWTWTEAVKEQDIKVSLNLNTMPCGLTGGSEGTATSTLNLGTRWR